ncbi:MAG TPA: hypothetical protein VN665_02395 [Candidatus Paceibacterota bacterium]|nr:hypothetical protein [Candidatus Paceibacterota bacterium]
MPDPKLEDIYRLTLDTNRQIHKMRRGILWGRFFTVVWWLIIVAVSGYTYYVYAQPYVNKIEQIYAQIGQTSQQAQSLQSEVSGFFGNFMQQRAATSTATSTR